MEEWKDGMMDDWIVGRVGGRMDGDLTFQVVMTDGRKACS